MVKMLWLAEDSLIGSGQTRNCYRHPYESNKCIKIMKTNSDSDVNSREFIYYQYLEKKQLDLTHLPKCYGFVETNYGQGLSFDLIGDGKGKTFLDLLIEKNISKEYAIELFCSLEKYLYKTGICFIDTNLDNIIVFDKEFFIIDGIIPPKVKRSWLYLYIPMLSRWRTRKSLKPARRKLMELFSEKLDGSLVKK